MYFLLVQIPNTSSSEKFKDDKCFIIIGGEGAEGGLFEWGGGVQKEWGIWGSSPMSKKS